MSDIYHQYNDFKSFEISFKDSQDSLTKFLCRLKEIEADKLIITTDNEETNGVIIPPGTIVNIQIYTDSGVYSSTAKILNYEMGMFLTIYEITYPTNSKHSQRREYVRANIPVPYTITIGCKDRKVKTISGHAKNVCGRGICILYNKPFVEYTFLQIELHFPENKIVTDADLVYSRIINSNKGQTYAHAFVFNTIQPKDTDFIVNQCFIYQLNHKSV